MYKIMKKRLCHTEMTRKELSKKVISVWHWLKYLLLRVVTIYKIMKKISCHTEMTLTFFIESNFCVVLAEIFATAGGNNL